MTPEEKGRAKRFNEVHKNLGALWGNASIGFFAGGLGLVYSEKAQSTYLELWAFLLGIMCAAMCLAAPQFMRDED
ncbi:hypothetical protein TomTYG75_10030 [Sphingobium sp. TomTYG75]